ncbi:MAG: hypothetical protein K2P92_03910, partial [Bdellovibrionaceae bacterium]|nr:hypothetical protein [Pseudobdellovibrionaceae bacterium]
MLYLVKTATFFIASLAFIAWGYRELNDAPVATESYQPVLNEAVTKNEIQTAPTPRALAANPLSMIESASHVFQDVGVINTTPPNDVTSDVMSEPRELSDNWNLSNTELTADIIAPYFEYSEPQQIVYYTANGVKVIHPYQANPLAEQDGQSLFVGTADSVAQTAEERQRRAEAATEKPHTDPSSTNDGIEPDAKQNSEDVALGENAFRVVFFRPGKRDNGKRLVPANPSPLSALQGPDYSFESASSDDDDTQKRVLSSVLSL